MAQDQPPVPPAPAPANPDDGFGYLLVLLAAIVLVVIGLSFTVGGGARNRNKDEKQAWVTPSTGDGRTPSTWRTPSTGHHTPRTPEQIESEERARVNQAVTSTLASLRAVTATGPASHLRNVRGSYDFSLLFGPRVTDEQRTEVANEVKRLLADPDAGVRLAAAEFVRAWPAGHAQLTAADADPVLRALLADKSNAIRVSAAAAQPSDPAAQALLLAVAQDATADVESRRVAVSVDFPAMIDARDRLAWDAKQPVALRVKAVAAQWRMEPNRPRTTEPLETAVTDPKEDPAFRAFVAQFFVPNSTDRFATTVRLMANADAALLLRRLLARQFRDHFTGDKRPPKEWVTDELAAAMAGGSSRFQNAQTEPGFDRDGNPWPVLQPQAYLAAEFDEVYIDALAARGVTVVPALVAALGNPALRPRNCLVLEKLGEAAKPAAEPLAKLLASADLRDPADLALVFRALEKVGGDRVPALLGALNRPAGAKPAEVAAARAARKWAAEQLGKIGPDAKAAVPALLERIRADIAADVAPFVAAVAAIGPDAVPDLGELLKHAEPKVRIAAAYALALIGPECRSKGTPLLRRAIEAEKDDEAKHALLNALGAINPAEAEKLGWQRHADARPDDVPIRVASANGRLELVRSPSPSSAFHYTPPPIFFLPRPAVRAARPVVPAARPSAPPIRQRGR